VKKLTNDHDDNRDALPRKKRRGAGAACPDATGLCSEI
jgi:hypothetical protein